MAKQMRTYLTCRNFARSLKIHSSTLSAIPNEKRKITPEAAYKIVRELKMDPVQQKKVLQQILQGAGRSSNPSFQILDDDQFALVSDWEHYAAPKTVMEVWSMRVQEQWIYPARQANPTYVLPQNFKADIRRPATEFTLVLTKNPFAKVIRGFGLSLRIDAKTKSHCFLRHLKMVRKNSDRT